MAQIDPLDFSGLVNLPEPVAEQQRKAAQLPEPTTELPKRTTFELVKSLATFAVNPLLGAYDMLVPDEVEMAGFRTENLLGSVGMAGIDSLGTMMEPAKPGYNAWAEIEGTKYEAYWKDVFVKSNSPVVTEAYKRSIDRQEEDRRLLQSSGMAGLLSATVNGIADPTVLIPGGGALSLGSKGIWRVGRSALVGAAAAGAGVAAQEAGLQASQDVRPMEESLLNISGAIVLGGVLGAAVGKMSRAELASSERALEELEQIAVRVPIPGSAGSAAVQGYSISDLTISGTTTQALAKATAITPNLRGNFRLSPVVRETFQGLADNPLYQRLHEEGKTVGLPVETGVRVTIGETLDQALPIHTQLAADAKKLGMRVDDFDVEVGRAMRRGDESDNSLVAKAASLWRKRVFDPLAERATAAGLLPEDLSVSEAPSYFSRVYNIEAMVANQPRFVAIASNWLNQQMQEGYAKQLEKLQKRLGRLEQERQDLGLTAEERTTALEEQQARLSALEGASPNEMALQTRINKLQADLRKASPDDRQVIRDQIKALRESGGEEFQAFLKERDDIRRRNRALSFNEAGLAEKSSKIEDRIAKASESNQRAMERLVTRGEKLAKELQRLDAAKAEAQVQALRDQFSALVERVRNADEKNLEAIEKLKEDPANAALAEKLEKARAQEAKRLARLHDLDERLSLLEGRDVKLEADELRAVVREMVAAVNEGTLSRAEKIARWRDKQAALDPQRITDRLAKVEELKKELEREFADKWEIGRLGKEIITVTDIPPDVKIGVDNPGGEWLERTRIRVRESGVLGPATAYTKKLVRFRPSDLIGIEGRNGENPKPGQPKFDALDKAVLAEGFKADEHPILISVDAGGKPWIMEGNNRIAVAHAHNAPYVSAQVQWHSGGELIDGPFTTNWVKQHAVNGVNESKVMDFTDHANDLAVDLFNRIVGNDFGSGVVDPQFRLPIAYGPLRDRTFHIPDVDIEEFLESNVRRVGERYVRKLAPQIELANRFGDVNMAEQLKRVEADYDRLMAESTSEKQRLEIQADREGAIKDTQAVRDILLGNYLAAENASTVGRVARLLLSFNYIRSMGGAAISSLTELYTPAMIHGLRPYMQGISAMMNEVTRLPLLEEARYAGIMEQYGHSRLQTMAEVGDTLAPGTALERFADNAVHIASKWNGLNMLTNFEKGLDAIIVQDKMNAALMGGKMTKDQRRWIAWSGMDEDMAALVGDELRTHATKVNDVWAANTEKWKSWEAVRAYRGAIARNVNSDIVTRGAGDIPLVWRRPMARLMTQFKSFAMAAHQRLLLRNMQLGKANMISGLIGLTTIGMLVSTVKAWRNGEESWEKFKESAKNPGYMIGEGLDASGLFTLPMEVGAITEKTTGAGGFAFNPTKTPLLAAGRMFNPDASMQGNTQRYVGGPIEAIAGPTAGLVNDATRAAGGALSEEPTPGQKRAAARLVPFNSYLGMKEMLQMLNEDSPYVD